MLSRLLQLSVIKKVCSELENHMGIANEDLAEFIIDLKKQSKSVDEFSQSLMREGAEFDVSFVQSLYRIIEAMTPKQDIDSQPFTGKQPSTAESEELVDDLSKTDHSTYQSVERAKLGTVENKSKFPGLAIPNRAPIYDADIIPELKSDHINAAANANNGDTDADAVMTTSSSTSTHAPRRKRRSRSKSRSKSRERQKKRDHNDRHRNRDRDRDRDRYSREGDGYNRDRDRYSRDRRDNKRRYHSRSRSRSHSPRNAMESDGFMKPRQKSRFGDNRNDRNGRSHNNNGRYGTPFDEKPILYKIYDGVVDGVKEFGCFVKLEGVDGRPSGLVHRNFITRDSAIPLVSNYVKRGQRVKVKVVSLVMNKIGLSMRSADQKTGEDLAPRPQQTANGGNMGGNQDLTHNPSRPMQGKMGKNLEDEDESQRTRARLSSPERWELKQLEAAGVLPPQEHPSFDLETGVLETDLEPEKELDIELNEHEPSFLKGQTGAMLELEPVKVVKNPDGSLQRAALLSSAMAKERREIRDQKLKQETDAVPVDLPKNWADPNAPDHDRVFAQSLRNMGQHKKEVAEWKRATSGRNFALGPSRKTPLQEQREALPIFTLKTELMRAVKDNDILVVIGQTGSGKTTQITQYLAECGYTSQGMIGCTQPRRVAAMSVAQRVSEEYGCRLGQEVGYCIRFEDCTGPETLIKYMTDGMLLRECLMDVDLKRYSVIMLDEAHERGISTDVLFALLKQGVRRRNEEANAENGLRPMKLIITSATLDAEKFSNYFNSCPIFTIPGRLYPVTIKYSRAPESDYLEAALITVLNIHLSEPTGDILVFLTGKEEIDTACQILYERCENLRGSPPLTILPVYSQLPSEMQTRIFEPAPEGTRKCVVATNIAEASLTIDGIYYVVDPGFVKQQVYNPKLRMDSLVITPISQNSANQRAGRAGRTGAGSCYRLYTQSAYKNEMLKATVPEIQRTNLGNTVLTLKAMGINDLLNFDFMDAPNPATLIAAMQQLYNLGALDEEGLLTRLGRKMAEFPLDPQLSKILIAAVDLRCAEEVLTVVSMLQSENIWFRPREKQAVADQKRAKFFQPEGDHITLLHVYEAWKEAKYSNPWCRDNFIQARAMRRVADVRKQLVAILDRYGLAIDSCKRNYIRVRKAIASGYFMHAARKDPQEGYKTLVEGQPAYIHPSSALFNHQPDWLIFHNLVLTSKEYMRECMVIEPKWLIDLAPRFFKKADPIRLSRRKRREKIEPLYDRYAEPNSWRLSRRRG